MISTPVCFTWVLLWAQGEQGGAGRAVQAPRTTLSLTPMGHTRYMQPTPCPPPCPGHIPFTTLPWPICSTNHFVGISGLHAVQPVSATREQDACVLTAVPFSFCQQPVVELHSSTNCSAALTQNPFSSGR